MLREVGAARGPRAHLQPTGAVALLLRDRLRHPRRADRRAVCWPRRYASPSARTRWGSSPSAALIEATTVPARPPVPGLLRRRLPGPRRRGRARQARAGRSRARRGAPVNRAGPGEHSAPPGASARTPGPERLGAGGAGSRGQAPSRGGLDYQAAGVSIEAGDRAVALMRDAVARTAGPEVVGGIGGFAGLFDASRLTGYRRPLLATSTDGVGTKVVIAQRLGRYDTVGHRPGRDGGGRPGHLRRGTAVHDRLRGVRHAAAAAGGRGRGGRGAGCELAGCALLGGETAEHPGHLGPDDFDLAGAATGVVEADALLGAGPGAGPGTWCSRWPRPGCTPTDTHWSGG